MKPRRTHVISVLVVALGLLFSLAGPAAAQATPGSRLANQFFLSLAGTPTTYALSPDALLHTPQGDYQGKDGFGAFTNDLAASFSEIAFVPGDAIQAGDDVIVSFTLTGINSGSWHGLEAKCAAVVVEGVARLQTEQQTYFLGQVDPDRPDEIIERTVVVEQWLSYESRSIDTQIMAFNSLDGGTRPACDGNDQDSAELAPTSPLPPSRSPNY